MADVEIRGLCKSFGGRAVLRDFDLTLRAHRVTALMGPSGAGKTTLLRILAGLDKPDAGRITGLTAARLSVVFQEDRLLDWLSPLENLRLTSPGLSPGDLRSALDRFGLADAADRPARELSGGMKRRVALLRALLYDSDVLLLDEPFNGLDDATRRTVAREALRLTGQRTTLLITHDEEEAALLNAGIVRMPCGPIPDYPKEVCPWTPSSTLASTTALRPSAGCARRSGRG